MNSFVSFVNDKFELDLERHELEIASISLLISMVFLGLSLFDYSKVLENKKRK